MPASKNETIYLTVEQASRLVGVNRQMIRRLLADGRILGRKHGRDWLVDPASAAAYRDSDRTPGRKPGDRHQNRPRQPGRF